jgi:hypothetical protein
MDEGRPGSRPVGETLRNPWNSRAGSNENSLVKPQQPVERRKRRQSGIDVARLEARRHFEHEDLDTAGSKRPLERQGGHPTLGVSSHDHDPLHRHVLTSSFPRFLMCPEALA